MKNTQKSCSEKINLIEKGKKILMKALNANRH